MEIKAKNPNVAIAILTILYMVGVLGIVLPLHEDFILLTPLNLLFSLVLVLYFHPNWTRGMTTFVGLAFGLGFGLEILGVQTGLVFGEYQYGRVLGYKILGTPLMIGVNWILLSYCSAIAAHRIAPQLNNFWKASLAAILLVILDVLIEPVAIKYDFWAWDNTTIPAQNYMAWFVISFVITSLFYRIVGTSTNKVAIALLILQFCFFALLNIF